MDGTLSQVLSTLFQYSQTIDRLQAEIQARDQRIAELEAQNHANNVTATPEPQEVPG